MIYCVDIDNTICRTVGSDYASSKPIKQRINIINHLYHNGNKIIIFTGRGSKSGKDWLDFTVKQLREWGVLYHELQMGKPSCDVIFDDKAKNIDDY
jgi:hypothetical protein